jgi:hypothetical protein
MYLIPLDIFRQKINAHEYNMQSAFQEIFGGRSAQYIWEAMVVNKSF